MKPNAADAVTVFNGREVDIDNNNNPVLSVVTSSSLPGSYLSRTSSPSQSQQQQQEQQAQQAAADVDDDVEEGQPRSVEVTYNNNNKDSPCDGDCHKQQQHPKSSSFANNAKTIPLCRNYIPTKAPKDTLQAVYRAGEYKAGLTMNLLCLQSIMAGIYIAMAGHLFLALGGGILGAAFFATGIIAVVLTSGELFTGDALVFVASVLGGRVSVQRMIRNWIVSWSMNFCGCLIWAYCIGYCSDALEGQSKEFAIAVALKKANQPWMSIFLKAVAANFMVCLGIWQATCAEETAGKILALWFPITGFVAMGLEHVIANQFFIPLGMMFGADVDIYKLFVQALLPATLGNLVGGGIFIGAVYWYVFDSMTSSMHLFSRIRQGWSNIVISKSRQRRRQQQQNNNADDNSAAIVVATSSSEEEYKGA